MTDLTIGLLPAAAALLASAIAGAAVISLIWKRLMGRKAYAKDFVVGLFEGHPDYATEVLELTVNAMLSDASSGENPDFAEIITEQLWEGDPEAVRQALMRKGIVTTPINQFQVMAEQSLAYLEQIRPGIVLPGWNCPRCKHFNGEAKEHRSECRVCELHYVRPGYVGPKELAS